MSRSRVLLSYIDGARKAEGRAGGPDHDGSTALYKLVELCVGTRDKIISDASMPLCPKLLRLAILKGTEQIPNHCMITLPSPKSIII